MTIREANLEIEAKVRASLGLPKTHLIIVVSLSDTTYFAVEVDGKRHYFDAHGDPITADRVPPTPAILFNFQFYPPVGP